MFLKESAKFGSNIGPDLDGIRGFFIYRCPDRFNFTFR